MIKLYVSGFVGNLGTKVLIDEKQDELVSQFNQEFINHIKNQIDESLSKDGFNPSLIMSSCMGEFHELPKKSIGELHDPKIVDCEMIGKGGILASLWKLCDKNKWGLKYSLRKIPILQGTIEVANYFELNPYRLLTNNSFVVAIDDIKSNMRCGGELHEPKDCGCEVYEPFSEIGIITNEKKRVRIDGEAEAFLTKDFKDEINKVIPNYTKTMGLI